MENDRTLLIVDGYNYLHSTMRKKNKFRMELEQLRNKLIENLNQLAKYRGWLITVIFDSSKRKRSNISFKGEKKDLVNVLFTKFGQSADNLAETLVYSNKGKKIFVVTSDYTHQKVAFGGGAFRMTTRQLKSHIEHLKKEIRKKDFSSNKLNIPISKRIDTKIANELDKIRKGKG